MRAVLKVEEVLLLHEQKGSTWDWDGRTWGNLENHLERYVRALAVPFN